MRAHFFKDLKASTERLLENPPRCPADLSPPFAVMEVVKILHEVLVTIPVSMTQGESRLHVSSPSSSSPSSSGRGNVEADVEELSSDTHTALAYVLEVGALF